MRPTLRVFRLAAAILIVSTCPVGAQTTAVGPYYAVPSWDQTIACTASASCPRFVVLSNMNNDAVLDRETGLVWQKSPTDVKPEGRFAQETCSQLAIGDRQGWRLPTLPELQSLVQPSKQDPALPDGHPFANVHFVFDPTAKIFDAYWTSTEDPANPGQFFLVLFHSFTTRGNGSLTTRNFLWCVRGGAGAVQ
jgi:hypothetical protein